MEKRKTYIKEAAKEWNTNEQSTDTSAHVLFMFLSGKWAYKKGSKDNITPEAMGRILTSLACYSWYSASLFLLRYEALLSALACAFSVNFLHKMFILFSSFILPFLNFCTLGSYKCSGEYEALLTSATIELVDKFLIFKFTIYQIFDSWTELFGTPTYDLNLCFQIFTHSF